VNTHPIRWSRRVWLRTGTTGIAALLSACRGGAPSQPAPARSAAPSGTIEFWAESGSDLARQLWDEMLKSFTQAYPQVTVNVIGPPAGENREQKLFAALAAGIGPDTWQRDIPPSYQQPLVDAEQVLALDPYYTTMPNLKRIFPWARKRGMINGKTWGVPHEVEFIPVFYNKRVFDELGIRQLPSTYDQLLTLGKTIKAAGVQPLTVATGRASPGHLYSAILMAVIGKDGTEEILYRNGRWDGEGPTRAAQLIVDLQNLEYLPKDPYDPQWNAGNDFPSGKVAMWPNGTWSLATYERNKQQFLGFDYGYFPFPLVNPNIKLTVAGGIGGGFSVNSKTKNVQASIAWIDHLMSAAAQKLWVEILIQVSPTPFKPEDYQVPEGVRAALRTIATGEEMGYNISVVSPAKFIDEYWDGLKAILQGQMQPKEWTARLQQQWEIAKNEGRVLKP